MSRAFTPPDTLSKDDIRTIADVRRDIWTNGFRGLVLGSLSGYVLHTVVRIGHQRKFWKIPTTANTAFVSFMLGGAVGSYVMAVTTGKNAVHRMHDIFQIGAKPPESKEG